MTTTVENFAHLLEESITKVDFRPGSVLDAKVLEVGSDYVTVSAGLKSESIIPRNEFLNQDGELEVNKGDYTKVAVIQFDEQGYTLLSRENAKRAEAWIGLAQAHEDGAVVRGIVSGTVKGGFTVDINSIRAFLPGSLVDVQTGVSRGPASIKVGEVHEFKVIKLDRKRNNIVVSRKAVLQQENSAEREAILEGLHEGKVIKGTIKNLTDYGAFVDLGGIDGLLHRTDIAWSRVNHPSEVLKVGDEVEVMVLKLDRERCRVSLGMKQLATDPWVGLAAEYPKGARLKGKVTNVTDYGCFVEVREGVEGLVHQSEMDWTNKNVAPSKVVAVGQEVEVMVLEIDEERRRISLGIKQTQANPWDTFATSHEKGQKISGKIKSITDFGIFIGLDGDIDGLVHLSDISWAESGETAIRNYKKGQEIEALILAIDAERERISLGIKQLEKNDFGSYIEAHGKGSSVTGKVIEVELKSATVELAPEVFGSIPATEVSRERVEDVHSVLNVGEEIEAKIINIDRKNRTITLSIKAHETAQEAKIKREYSKKAVESAAGATLGDILKEQMSNNGSAESNSENSGDNDTVN
ncbi:MAG: 30S ribosomal protein S1 [Gammaproteobacteria bacterium]